MEYSESIIEQAFYDLIVATTAIKSFGVEIRRFFDQSEPAKQQAIVVRAFQTSNLNFDCHGGGKYFAALLSVYVVGDVPKDTDKTKLNMIAGAVEDLLIDVTEDFSIIAPYVATGVTVDGIIFDGNSESIDSGVMMGKTLPSLKVFFHKQ
jgi:hypothetical protein